MREINENIGQHSEILSKLSMHTFETGFELYLRLTS